MEEVLKVEKEGHAKVLVVLDDDPTGTQTVHEWRSLLNGGYILLRIWLSFSQKEFESRPIQRLCIHRCCRSVDTLKKEFENSSDCFFILTNSRALNTDEVSIWIFFHKAPLFSTYAPFQLLIAVALISMESANKSTFMISPGDCADKGSLQKCSRGSWSCQECWLHDRSSGWFHPPWTFSSGTAFFVQEWIICCGYIDVRDIELTCWTLMTGTWRRSICNRRSWCMDHMSVLPSRGSVHYQRCSLRCRWKHVSFSSFCRFVACCR